MTPSGQVTILHFFGDGSVTNDGYGPNTSLIQASDGNLYGTTPFGGTSAVGAELGTGGTAFQITLSGQVTIMHRFGDGSVADDGLNPNAPLMQASDGKLYGVTTTGGASSNGGVVFSIDLGLLPRRFDFNGDGHPDILWHNSQSGQLLIWDMDDTQTLLDGQTFATVPDQTWQVVATADVFGTGQQDLIWWNNQSDDLLVWTMNGTQVAQYGQPFVQVADTTWHPVAVGDVTGDGHWSLIWENYVSGDILRWKMLGTSVLQYGQPFAQVSDTTWHIVGSGDMDGDGHTDLLWENSSTGDVLVWHMDNTQVLQYGQPFVQIPDTTWQITGLR